MDLRESSRSGMKRDVDDSFDMKGDRVGVEEDLDGGDKRKYRSSKPRKHGNVEEIEERDSSERRKSSGDRTESRKRSGGLSRVGSGDEDEYNTKKESHSKLLKRNQDEKIEKKSSSVYQEKETESSRKSRDVSGSKGYGVADETERESSRKSGSKPPVHETGSKGYGVADETERESSRKSGLKPPVHETGSKGYGVADETERESSRKSGSKPPVHETGSKGYGVADETERESSRKSGSKPPVHEIPQSKSRSKLNSFHDIEQEMAKDRDSRYAERKESSRDKNHGFRETEKSSKRRWDEPDPDRKGEGSNYVDKPDSRSEKISHIKHGNDRERSSDIRNETVEPKSRIRDSNSDKAIKPSSGEGKLIDGEKTRSRGKPEVYEEDNRPGSVTREDKSGGPREDKLRSVREKPSRFFDDIEPVSHKPITRGHDEKSETHMHQSNPVQGVHDIDESREKSVNRDEDGRARTRDRSGREVRYSRRSWSPERSGRRHPQSYDSGSDNERSNNLKGKERETESYRDDRIRGRDSNWSDKNRERESSKDNWKRRHESNSDKDSAYVVVDFDHDIDWDVQRRDRERNGNDKLHSHPGYRKLGRTESVKSSYGNPNRSSDMIEIRPSSIDFRREESGSVFAGRKSEGAAQTDYTSATGDDQWGYQSDDRMRMDDSHGPGDDPQERYADDGSSVMSQNSGRNYNDMQGEKGRGHMGVTNSNHSGGPNPNSGSQSPFGNNQGSGNFNRMTPQGAKGSRLGRGGRGRPIGRDGPRGMPLPMMGPPFGPLGIPQGPMQTLGPNMSPGHCPPMGLGVFIPPYPGPNVWPGARGVDVNMLSVPHGLSPVPPGPSPPRFPPNVTGPNPAMYFNQQGPARGVSPNMPGSGFNAMGTMGRGMPNDKPLGGWTPRTSGTLGKAPSRGEQNDYSQNFVDTGMRPQNYIRELLELTNTVEDYPKLRELIQRKDEIVAKSASPPMYYKCDLRDFVLSPEFFGTKFDVILVDPPWEEYVHRAPGVADHMDYWTFEEISNLNIEAIADTPSFIFLWVGDGVGLEQGRQCLRKWGFRRCEDICWVKTNKSNSTSGLRHDSHTLFQHSKEHCLMGIKGTVRRSTDGHVIHANIDTDIVIAEEPPYGSTTKPEDLYRIIEHFSLGRRRIELFGEDHNIRSGWMTVGKDLSSSNFNAEAYIRNFCDKDAKVWQGGGGRNPPPGAPHLMVTTPEIEGLRPKSPPPKNQQQQQPTMSLTQTTTNSANRRPMANSPQTPTPPGINQEASSSYPSTPAQWASSPMVETKTPETTGMATDEKGFDGYGFEAPGGQLNAGHLDFGSLGASNML